jgi:hypothetical protein
VKWLRHAFAVDPPGPAEPTPEQQGPVDWVCRQIIRRGLTTPGLVMLEVTRPLNYIMSMGMHAASPLVWAVARQQAHEGFRHFATFMEQRGAMEYIARRIETLEKAQASRPTPAEGRDEEDHDEDRS